MAKILQWNVNGFINQYEYLQQIMKSETPDIICLQETNIKGDDIIKSNSSIATIKVGQTV